MFLLYLATHVNAAAYVISDPKPTTDGSCLPKRRTVIKRPCMVSRQLVLTYHDVDAASSNACIWDNGDNLIEAEHKCTRTHLQCAHANRRRRSVICVGRDVPKSSASRITSYSVLYIPGIIFYITVPFHGYFWGMPISVLLLPMPDVNP